MRELARAAGFEPALHGFGDRPTTSVFHPFKRGAAPRTLLDGSLRVASGRSTGVARNLELASRFELDLRGSQPRRSLPSSIASKPLRVAGQAQSGGDAQKWSLVRVLTPPTQAYETRALAGARAMMEADVGFEPT
jgi:hypothetical protein